MSVRRVGNLSVTLKENQTLDNCNCNETNKNQNLVNV